MTIIMKNRTIVITTHQVEEVESILTHIIMLHEGKKILDCSMSDLGQQYYCIRAKKGACRDTSQPASDSRKKGSGTCYLYVRPSSGVSRSVWRGILSRD